ncbi:hypothetical protein SLE2022_168880 [Rubroshorea leprosula]
MKLSHHFMGYFEEGGVKGMDGMVGIEGTEGIGGGVTVGAGGRVGCGIEGLLVGGGSVPGGVGRDGVVSGGVVGMNGNGGSGIVGKLGMVGRNGSCRRCRAARPTFMPENDKAMKNNAKIRRLKEAILLILRILQINGIFVYGLVEEIRRECGFYSLQTGDLVAAWPMRLVKKGRTFSL